MARPKKIVFLKCFTFKKCVLGVTKCAKFSRRRRRQPLASMTQQTVKAPKPGISLIELSNLRGGQSGKGGSMSYNSTDTCTVLFPQPYREHRDLKTTLRLLCQCLSGLKANFLRPKLDQIPLKVPKRGDRKTGSATAIQRFFLNSIFRSLFESALISPECGAKDDIEFQTRLNS